MPRLPPELLHRVIQTCGLEDCAQLVALLGLIDECPVIHAAIAASCGSRTQAIGAAEFDFISENRQIESIESFLASLPDMLRG